LHPQEVAVRRSVKDVELVPEFAKVLLIHCRDALKGLSGPCKKVGNGHNGGGAHLSLDIEAAPRVVFSVVERVRCHQRTKRRGEALSLQSDAPS
jgi:hypothetical protein